MKHDYTALDDAILAELRRHTAPQMAWKLWNASHIKLAALAISDAVNLNRGYWQKMPEHAPLDRRIQALRKAGRIRYQRKPEGWVLADDNKEPTNDR